MSYILPIDSLFDPTILQTLVEQISLDTGYQIQVQIYRSPREAFEKLRSQEIHLVWMQPLTYLAAYERGLVEPMIVSNHYGLYQYGTMVLANQDSNFVSYFNEEENISTAPADIALRQLEGKRPCYVNESSLSGKIIPEGYLALNGIQPLNAVITQSYPATIRSLYIKGVCDFGATFAYTGDPRTSSQVLNDLPNALTQIDIIWRSDPVIPSLSLSSSSQVPDLIVETITQDFLAKVQTEEGKQQLTNALQYDVQDLLPIDHDFFGPFSLYVYASKVVPFQHLGY